MPFIEVQGRTLHYADSNPSDERKNSSATLLMIHGLGSSQNFFFPILPWLRNFRCIIPDTSGAGRSSLVGTKLSIREIADHAHALLDKLQIQKASIVGHSMGGTVALDFAARYPDRTSAVIAIGPIDPNNDAAGIFKKRIEVVSKDGMEPMADSIPKAATGSKSTSLHHAFIRELILGQNPAGYIANCKAIINAEKPDYAAIKAPFIAITGQDDRSAPLDGCKAILDRLSSPRKSLTVLEGVGHWHCIEASEEVGRAISEFCASI